MNTKYQLLKQNIAKMGSVAVAFSGGVDSTFLMKVAHDVLGENAFAVTIRMQAVPEREELEAARFCREEGIRQVFADIDALAIKGFVENPPDRCYHCKKEIFTRVIASAKEAGAQFVLEGSNVDDTSDYRPGMRAIKELGIRSPLMEAGLTKEEIRVMSKELGLLTWDKPAMACLASRFVTGETITEKKLSMVERGEDYLRDLGLKQFRLRMHGEDLARIEVLPEQIDEIIARRKEIEGEFRKIGFRYVAVDLGGYHRGNMNPVLDR